MSISSIGKVMIGVAVLAFGYGVSRFFFQKGNPATNSSHIVATKAVTSCKDVQEIQSLMSKVEKATDLGSAYSVSIPLLGATYLNDGKLYDKWEKAIFDAFKISKEEPEDSIVEKLQEKTSFNAWVLGRLLVANLRRGDKESAQKIASIMEKLLEKSSVDPFSAWARGYLAIYYANNKPQAYPLAKEKMLACTDALMQQPGEKGKDNVSWAIVMELQSLADVGDRETCVARLQKFLDFTGTTSVVEALKTIPSEDFRAWATSLVLRAAKKIDDQDQLLVNALTDYLPQALAASPSDGDKMLALLVNCSN
jgi:hypothetical protein